MIEVSIIIVNYNCSRLTIKAVDSIFLCTREVDFEIIIVDNNSMGKEKMLLIDYCSGKNNVVLVQNAENIGFGRANNIGAKSAQGEILFFLNPDTILLNDAISILFQYLKNNISVGICGGQLYDENGNKMHSYSMFLPGIGRDWDTAVSGIMTKIRLLGKQHQPFAVGYITGADLMIRKSLFYKIKGFDPDFFMYYEESEMTHRIRKLGYSIICCPEAKIVHLEGKTHEFNEAKLRMIFTGRLLYMLKTKSKFNYKVTDLSYRILHKLNQFILKLKGDKTNCQRIKNKMNIYKDVFSRN